MDYYFKIPIKAYPDQEGVTREYHILSNLACPMCRHTTLQVTRQKTLTNEGNSESPFPVVGDHMVCECNNCKHTVEIMFEFVSAEAAEKT